MNPTCTNPTCGITLSPGATKCWLCGVAVNDVIGELENRVRELEHTKMQLCDDSVRRLEQVTKLTAEVSRLQAAASRPCPADGMSDEEVGYELLSYAAPTIIWSQRANEDTGAVARELFGKGTK